MRGFGGSTKDIEQTAKFVGAGFATLAAVGGLVKAAGGPNVLAIGFAAVGVIGTLVALAFLVLQQHAEDRDAEQALWRAGTSPALVRDVLADDGVYELGAETEAPEALNAVGLVESRHAPVRTT